MTKIIDLCNMKNNLQTLRDAGVAMNIIAKSYNIEITKLRARLGYSKIRFNANKATELLQSLGYRVADRNAFFYDNTERNENVENCLGKYGFDFIEVEKKSDFQIVTLLLSDSEKRKFRAIKNSVCQEAIKQRVINRKRGIR